MIAASGSIELHSLHEIAAADPEGRTLDGRSVHGRSYGKTVTQLTSSIADQQGFYLWGFYDDRCLWQNLYLGKAGFGKTANLRARIAEELRDERWFLWVNFLSPERFNELGLQYHPTMWARSYRRIVDRAMRKAGTTMIAWAATPDINGRQVLEVEADLIETLNPTANRARPVPPHELQRYTPEIVAAFRHFVHDHRPSKGKQSRPRT
jgi:hypothetical protein